MSETIVKPVNNPDELEELFRLRYKIYCEDLHWLDSSNYPDRLEKDEYDQYSLHFGAFNDGHVIGTTRLVLSNPLGLPIKEILGQTFSPAGKAAEISRLIVDGTYDRSKYNLITIALIKQVYYAGKHNEQITDWYAAFDVAVHRLVRMIGFKFQAIDKPRLFMGSKTVPSHITTIDADDYFLTHNKNFYAYLNSKTDVFFKE